MPVKAQGSEVRAQPKRRRTRWLWLTLPIVLAVGALYLRVLVKRVFFETSQNSEEGVRTRLTEAALQAEAGNQASLTLYFPSPNDGRLVTEKRSMAMATSEVDRIREVLLALIEGPRAGGIRALPPSTTVRSVFLTSDGTAFVDFADDVTKGFAAGIQSETLAVYAIVNSLAAGVPAVKRVKILVQGREAETLDGHADLTGYFTPTAVPSGE